jgi:molybdopterin-containing oxidoreductase family iron-sulfur binding subunit
MNAALGSVGRTVRFIEDPLAAPGAEPFAALAEELAAGRVHALLMLDVNPIYDAPANWPFAEWLRQVPFSVHLGLYRDETGRLCNWHVPLAHPLEMWSDAISSDGTAVIVQPLIRPLYGGRNPHELLALLADELDPSPRAVLRSYWAKRVEGADDAWWDEALRTGVVQQPPPRELGPPPADALARLMGEFAAPPAEGVEVRFAPDHTIWDGRYANNAWLQEIPDPLTKLCWTNAALLSPRTAARLNIRSGNYVRIVLGEARLTAPAWILPGHADESVTLPLGYGRPHAGRVGSRVGYDALALRPSEAPWFAGGAKLEASGGRAELATTQQHHAMEGREHVRVAIAGAASAGEGHHPAASRPSLYPDFPQDGPQWGMVIDLARCIGCNACMVACQAENNIPVVGAEGVRRGREMHWIRLDRYFRGDEHNPDIHHQPVPCMHCEKAPCELVCPVAATSHSRDGLNEMTYNRCVGTRYCSNNCPYKVRRFNFLEYVDRESPTLAMQRNPDVTVRSRGVMEKCTYCVQRIRAAEIVARRTDRPVGPQDVVTACQQVCPTQAIVFGNIKAAGTPVAEARRHPDHYALLAELNTRPRTTYLADLKNPNRSMG